MARFPGLGFPYYNPYYNMNYRKTSPYIPPKVIEEKPHKSTNETDCKSNAQNKSKTSQEEPWLDIFGIKLYFDDVLILSLLYFLYTEEVKDEGLFIALILLLIS